MHASGFNPQPASGDSDQPDQPDVVRVVQGDITDFLFEKNGIAYSVETLPENATSTLDILKSWQFI